MHFATLPPEINSGRMYSGSGSASMTEAATAWDRLAARLYTAVADYRAVASKVAARWEGPPSTAITQAAPTYIDWLTAAAAQAEHAATQAAAAASAHETALAAVVPPVVIEANRALQTSLAMTNCLGQTSPAIANTDAGYEQMWAKDAAAMYAYAGASANAATITPFTSPPGSAGRACQGAPAAQSSGSSAVTSAPEVTSAGHQVMSTIPETLHALSLSPLAAFDASLSSVTSSLSQLSSLSAPSGFAISHLNSLNKAAALRWLLTQAGVVFAARQLAQGWVARHRSGR